MKRGWIFAVLCIVVLTGCTPKPSEEVVQEKKPFFISILSPQNNNNATAIKKSGKILGAQDVTVSSQVSARVERITRQLGDTVSKNQIVLELSDSSGTYSFSVQKAKAALDQAKINYEQTMNDLNKALTDTRIAVQQAENQTENATLQQTSSASLQLQQLDEQIANAEYDYETKVVSDRQTLDNFVVSSKKLLRDVQLLYQDVLTETDKILGASSIYADDNDPFEQLLGARNTATRQAALSDLRRLLQDQRFVETLSSDFTEENLEQKLSDILDFSENLTPFLIKMDTMLNFTATNSNFGDARLNGLRSTINGLQTQVQNTNAGIIQQRNSIQSFLRTYKNQQESLLNTIDTLRTQRRTQASTLTTAEENAGLSLETAQSTYEATLKTKDTTEASLLNAIEQAQIRYNETLNEASKLTVESPIEGTIGDILVDVGQEISIGTPLFTVISIQEQQVEIALTSDELSFASPGMNVQIVSEQMTLSGSILSITRTADATLTYKAVITLDTNTELLGSVVTVMIPVESTKTLIPLKYVTVINTSQGVIYLLENGSISEEVVSLGKIWGNMIEITSPLDASVQIITTDVSNYDPEQFELTIQE